MRVLCDDPFWFSSSGPFEACSGERIILMEVMIRWPWKIARYALLVLCVLSLVGGLSRQFQVEQANTTPLSGAVVPNTCVLVKLDQKQMRQQFPDYFVSPTIRQPSPEQGRSKEFGGSDADGLKCGETRRTSGYTKC
jgi:hypothetical protein